MERIIIAALMLAASGIECAPLPPSHTNTISFQLVPGSLEQNISELLNSHSDNRILLWQVSKKHQVIVDAVVTGNNIYHVLDQIISPYSEPFQIKASVFTKNGVVRIHYDSENL